MRFRNTLVMAFVLAMLGGFVYFYEIRGREAREEAERAAKRLLTFATEDVRSLTLETDEGPIIAVRSGDEEKTWSITAPYKVAADESAIETLLNRLSSAQQQRLIAEDVEDFSPFGLDQPAVRAKLELEDGNDLSLELGKDTPVGSNVYARRGNDQQVYITPASLKNNLGKSLFDLRDKRIFTFEDDDVARVELASNNLELSVRRVDKADTSGGKASWKIVTPSEGRADAETLSGTLRRLRTHRAAAFASEAPAAEQLEEFGLDHPETTLTIWTKDDTSQTLEIGSESQDPSGYYARRRGSEAVFVVPTDLVSNLPVSVDDIRDRSVLEIARDQVTALELNRQDRRFRVEKAGTDWRISEPRHLEADASAVSNLLTTTLNLKAKGFAPGPVDTPRYGLQAPELSVALLLKPEPPAQQDQADGQSGKQTSPAEAQPEAQQRSTYLIRVGAVTEIEPDEGNSTGGEDSGKDGPKGGKKKVAARYVATSGDPTVYIVAQDDLDDFDVDLFRLRAKTLLSFTQSDLTRIEIDTGVAHFAVEKKGDDWSQVEPSSGKIEGTGVSDLLWDMNYLRMEGVAAEWDLPTSKPDMEPFGLQPPAYRLTAYAGAEKVADVELGSPVPQSALAGRPEFSATEQVYVRVADRKAVFQVAQRLRGTVEKLLSLLQAPK